MVIQTLLEETPISIQFDHLNNWLIAEWHGNQNLTTVQQGCANMLRLMQQQHCHKVLNDNTDVTSMWSEAAEWGGKEWFPAMAAAGLHYFAWVYSSNVYSRLSTDLTLQFTGPEPIIATFDDRTTAEAWLQQV